MKETFSQSSNFKGVNKYLLAIAIAKRAREITDRMDLKGEASSEKSVELAIKDFKEERCKIKNLVIC